MEPLTKQTACTPAEDCPAEARGDCGGSAAGEPQSVEVRDLRFRGHPARVVLPYPPVDCPQDRTGAGESLPGVYPASGKSYYRYSVRLVRAVNGFLIRNDPELARKKLRYIAEACDIPCDAVRRWREREQRAAKAAYDRRTALLRLQKAPGSQVLLTDDCRGMRFLYALVPGRSPALLAVHAAEDWENLRVALLQRRPRAVNRIQADPPAFFDLACDFLRFETDCPPALGALLLTYLRFHVTYETALRLVAGELPEPLRAYYGQAMDWLMATYWERLSSDKDKDGITDLLWISSRKLVPYRRETEKGTNTAKIRYVWDKCRRLAKQYGVEYRPRLRRTAPAALRNGHAELCGCTAASSLTAAELAGRLLAFNSYALSAPPRRTKRGAVREPDFTAQGDFTHAFTHLENDGGMPLEELLRLVRGGLLSDGEADGPAGGEAAPERG